MIKHNTSTVIVFQSVDYKNFTMIKGNRALNQNKINRIIAEIEGGNDMLPYYPIQVRIVGDKMEILDGQHRFFICKKLNRPVHYIMITERKSMSDIAKINSNVEKWKPQDFINCYVQQGNDHYKKLQKFLDEFGINIGTSIRLLSSGTPGAEGSNADLKTRFEHGEFAVTHWKEANTLANECKRFDKSNYWHDRGFVIAVHRIQQADLIKIDQLVEAFNKRPEMLTQQASHKEYVYNLEQIVNVNKQKRIVII